MKIIEGNKVDSACRPEASDGTYKDIAHHQCALPQDLVRVMACYQEEVKKAAKNLRQPVPRPGRVRVMNARTDPGRLRKRSARPRQKRRARRQFPGGETVSHRLKPRFLVRAQAWE